MPIEVTIEPYTTTGAAQYQGDILAGKALYFNGSVAIGCVDCLGVQRACATQCIGFVGLKVGDT